MNKCGIQSIVFILLAVMLVLPGMVLAQDGAATITCKKGALGNKYFQDGKILSLKKLNDLLATVPAAGEELEQARKIMNKGNLLAYPGGFLIGYPIGYATSGAGLNVPMILCGCVLAGAGIYISLDAHLHYENAIAIFNRQAQ
ncbi:MAG: hypothetical protein ABIA75_04930 [Candidatus Neomarinimicrobiota bacterium]